MECKNVFHCIITSHKIVEFDRVIAKCIFFLYIFWDFFHHKYCMLMWGQSKLEPKILVIMQVSIRGYDERRKHRYLYKIGVCSLDSCLI
jgi:hypothetical protein